MVNCSLIPKDRKCVKCGSAKTWTRNIGGRFQPVWHRSESDFLCSISMTGSKLSVEDRTMQTLYDLAKELGPTPTLPDSLKDACKLAKYLDYVDRQIIPISHTINLNEEIEKRRFISNVAELTVDKVLDVQDENIRANLTLRLWSGAWDAAKALRDYSASL